MEGVSDHTHTKGGWQRISPHCAHVLLFKTMERCLYHRLRWHTESRGVIPDSQLGFRNLKSWGDSLVLLTSQIYEGFLSKSPTVAVFLDITGAFDNVIPEILLSDLERMGVSSLFRKFEANMITVRHIQFVCDGELSQKYLTYKGTLQGATLSPMLFNIYVKDIGKMLHADTKILQYADDIVIFSIAEDPHDSICSINLSLENIFKSLRSRGLEISPTKSKCMFFSKGKCNNNNSSLENIYVGNQIVPWVPFVKFLGIELDPGLIGKSISFS